MRNEKNSMIAVLVADQDKSFTEAVGRYLARLDFQVEISNSAAQAVEKLESRHFDMMLAGKAMDQELAEIVGESGIKMPLTRYVGKGYMSSYAFIKESMQSLEQIIRNRQKLRTYIRGIESVVEEIIALYEEQIYHLCFGGAILDLSGIIEGRTRPITRLTAAEQPADWIYKESFRGMDPEETRYLIHVYDELVHTMVRTMKTRDAYTEGHSRRVSELSGELAAELGLDEKVVTKIRLGGMFHDVGKIGIADRVLQKNGKLSSEEFEDIKMHTLLGTEILSNGSVFSEILPMVRNHHEKMDGSGYPDGLAGEEIPLEARIVAIADAYDAMRAGRIYQQAKPREEVLEELRKGAGSQFDQELVEVFIQGIERGNIDKQ